MTPEAYVDLIDQRFSNKEIIDTVRRVAFDGSSRQTGFVLPTLRDALARGSSADGLILSQAVWARMCAGTREDGSAIAPNDPLWDSLSLAAEAAKKDPQAWLDQRPLYGDLADNDQVRDRFNHWLTMIYAEGLDAALSAFLKG